MSNPRCDLPVFESNIRCSDEDDNVFTWQPPENEGKLYFDRTEIVRFRVEEEKWHDIGPAGPVKSEKARKRLQEVRAAQLANGQQHALGVIMPAEEDDDTRAPYTIIVSLILPSHLYWYMSFRFRLINVLMIKASMCADGLGPVQWW